MKNVILIVALFLFGGNLFAQSEGAMPSLEETVAAFTTLYNLDEAQQEKILEVQQRKFRNFGEIEALKTSDPKKYQQKVTAMQRAEIKHMHDILNEGQLKIFRERQVELRKKKAELFKEMKGSATGQADIEKKLTELEVEALLNG